MLFEEEKTINKERKEKEQDYDFNGSFYTIFTLGSFI
jgi:hypothetical protein